MGTTSQPKIIRINLNLKAYCGSTHTALLPPKDVFRVLTPRIPDCGLISRQGFYISNQIKMTSVGWIIIQYD